MVEKHNRACSFFLSGAVKSLPVIIGMIPGAAAFGILARTAGLTVWESLFMSAVVFAGASQYAALNLLMTGASAVEIIITTALLNARHIMMGSSLSQKLEKGMGPIEKLSLFFFLTDESFSIASLQEEDKVSPQFLWGLQLPIYFTWSTVTVCGYLGTSVLPASLQASMGIAIYALLISLIIPPARKSRAALAVTGTAMLLSVFLRFVPPFSGINRGISIIISAGAAALLGAWLYPEGKGEESR